MAGTRFDDLTGADGQKCTLQSAPSFWANVTAEVNFHRYARLTRCRHVSKNGPSASLCPARFRWILASLSSSSQCCLARRSDGCPRPMDCDAPTQGRLPLIIGLSAGGGLLLLLLLWFLVRCKTSQPQDYSSFFHPTDDRRLSASSGSSGSSTFKGFLKPPFLPPAPSLPLMNPMDSGPPMLSAREIAPPPYPEPLPLPDGLDIGTATNMSEMPRYARDISRAATIDYRTPSLSHHGVGNVPSVARLRADWMVPPSHVPDGGRYVSSSVTRALSDGISRTSQDTFMSLTTYRSQARAGSGSASLAFPSTYASSTGSATPLAHSLASRAPPQPSVVDSARSGHSATTATTAHYLARGSPQRRSTTPRIVVTRASGQTSASDRVVRRQHHPSVAKAASEAGSSLASSLASHAAATETSSLEIACSRYEPSHGSSFQGPSEFQYAPSSLKFDSAAPSTLGAVSTVGPRRAALAQRNVAGGTNASQSGRALR
jgi:hypothetical protein